MQKCKIKISLERPYNAIESRYESIDLKGWLVSLGIKLIATGFLGQTAP